MMGMDEVTGKLIGGDAWLRQAVRRAVRTGKGTKPMVRWYGTNLLRHVAREATSASLLEFTSDLAESIESTIPAASLKTVINPTANGEQIEVSLSIESRPLSLGV